MLEADKNLRNVVSARIPDIGADVIEGQRGADGNNVSLIKSKLPVVRQGQTITPITRPPSSDLARRIARKLVIYQRRGSEQSQLSALRKLDPKSDRVQLALAYAQENSTYDLSVEALAGRSRCLTQRPALP